MINNRLIAKNTIMLYFRMAVVVVVNLYTSRIILDSLGIDDFGIYSVVGGLVSLLTIISGSLTSATSRYLTYSLAKGNPIHLKKVFATAINIHIILSIFVLLIAETIGVWILNNKLTIPEERIIAANWLFQFSLLSFLVRLLNVPYSASVISHERMGVFAYLSLFDVFANLGIVYFLYITSADRLILYGFLILLVGILYQMMYFLYCRFSFSECRYSFSLDRKLLKEMSIFIGWAFWGNAAVVAKDHGMVLLINIFCGPAVNAAQGVASKVNSAAFLFVHNFQTAASPQLTKSYSAGEYDNMHQLLSRCSRFSTFLMILIIAPIIANVDILLSLWLIEVPPHSNSFVILILIYSLIACYTQPMIVAILSTGNIKPYELWITFIYAVNILSAFWVLNKGMQPEVVYLLLVIFKVCVFIVQLLLSKSLFGLDRLLFIKHIVTRVIPVIIVAVIAIQLIHFSFAYPLVEIIINSIIIDAILLLTICGIGMENKEVVAIWGYINKKAKKCLE